MLSIGVAACATCAPLNPSYTTSEFQFYLSDLRADAVVVQAGVDTPARVVAERLNLKLIELTPDLDGPVGCFTLAGDGPAVAARPGAAGPSDIALVMHTSGTTARPKLVPLTQENLCAAISVVRDWFDFGPDDRCLNLMPLFHIMGLGVGLLSQLAGGGSVICPPEFSQEVFFGCLRDLAPTWYNSGPTFNKAILAGVEKNRDAFEGNRLRFIHTAGAAMSVEDIEAIESVSGAPLIESYGLTEVTMHATSNPLPPGKRKPGTVGLPACGDVAIMDQAGKILLQGETGEVVIRGRTVMSGYENYPEANAEAFQNGWFRTGDGGTFDTDGYLRLTGRIKDIINRGGEKIAPMEVDKVLQNHGDVAEVATFPVYHPSLGEEVAAAVVLKSGRDTTEAELEQFAQQYLAPFKVPRRFLLVDEIPKGPTSKIQRSQLAKALGLEIIADSAPAKAGGKGDRPPTPVEAQLTRIWENVLGREHIGLHDNFFMLGGDSLQAVELLLQIEKQLGRSVSQDIIFEAGTVAEMAERIKGREPPRNIVLLQLKGDLPPFFCVHDVGGGVLNLHKLAHHLGPTQPCYGIQYPGAYSDELFFDSIESLAAHYVDQIREVRPRGPYFLGGYSLGGRIAQVMAQQLRDIGEDVPLLVLLDTYSHIGARWIGFRQWIERNRERVGKLGPAELAAYAIGRVRRVGGSIVRGLWLRFLYQAWRFCGDRELSAPRILCNPEYVIEMLSKTHGTSGYNGNVILFKTELTEWQHPDLYDGWRDIVGGELQSRTVPGRHGNFLQEPQVRALASELRMCLAEAYNQSSGQTTEYEPG